MSQTFTDDPYEQSYVADTSLVNYENNDLALKSMFSGAAAPSNLVAFMPWGDTAKGLKRRNNDNTAWLVILSGDANQKMYVYRNDTCEGWVIDSAITDRVLAIKGGTEEYNINGGNTSSWANWDHTLTIAEMPVHNHDAYKMSTQYYATLTAFIGCDTRQADTTTIQSTGGGGTHNHGRPGAAVGTLQYPDL